MRKLNFLRPARRPVSVDTQVLTAIQHLAKVLGMQSLYPWQTQEMRQETRRAIKELRAVVAALA